MDNTGILIIAVGAKNYGQLAGSLAASIRANNCQLPIHLVYQEDTITRLDEQYLSLFTSKSIIPEHCITYKEKTCYIKAKAHMNELTPFEKTLFLDADILMLNNGKINEIIEQLKDVEFAVKNSGYKTYDIANLEEHQWANLGDVKKAFEFTNEKIWNVHSEFIWWKKTPKMNELFERWAYNFENMPISHIEFGGCIPDELPLWISMAQLGVEPHKEMFLPIFWPMDSKDIKRVSDLRNDYVGLSIGGNVIAPTQKNNYDILITLYAKILNLRHKFFCHPKKKWVSERHTY
jgi:hypothetical protein